MQHPSLSWLFFNVLKSQPSRDTLQQPDTAPMYIDLMIMKKANSDHVDKQRTLGILDSAMKHDLSWQTASLLHLIGSEEEGKIANLNGLVVQGSQLYFSGIKFPALLFPPPLIKIFTFRSFIIIQNSYFPVPVESLVYRIVE